MHSCISQPRRLVIITSATLLVSLLALACSSSDDESSPDQPAAVRVDAPDFQIASPNFTEIRPRVRIPQNNTCYGDNLSPPLAWSGAPADTKSFALVGEDIDEEGGARTHWVLYNIPSGSTELIEGIPTSTDVLPDNTVQGANDFENIGYNGPCPQQISINYYDEFGGKIKSSKGAHQYVFRLYALDSEVSLAPGATKAQLLNAIESRILAETDTVGKYQVPPTTDRAQEMERTLYGTPTAVP